MATKTKIPTIQSTTNYSQFNFFDENRGIDPANYKNLRESIEEVNLLHLKPIVVDQDMYVIDGQHRLQVAADLGVPIYYVQGEIADIHAVINLNANMRPWKLKDYLQYFCKKGKQDYIELREFQTTHDLNITDAINLLGFGGTSAWQSALQKFKRGNFEIRTREVAEDFIDKIEQLSKFYDFAKTRSFIRAFMKLYKSDKFDFERLYNKATYASRKVQRSPNADMYLRQLDELYNFNTNDTVHFF